MRARLFTALLFVAGLLAYLPAAQAGKLEDKALATVEKLAASVDKAEASFDKWLGWVDGQLAKPGACAKLEKIGDKAYGSAEKQWDKLHSVVHKARETLDKLGAQGADPGAIAAAHQQVDNLWFGYWDAEDDYMAALATRLADCP